MIQNLPFIGKYDSLIRNLYGSPLSFVMFSLRVHCVKSVRIRSYSGPYFSGFRLNTERYSISFCNQFECGKIRTRINPNTDTFYAVLVFNCTLSTKNSRYLKKYYALVLCPMTTDYVMTCFAFYSYFILLSSINSTSTITKYCKCGSVIIKFVSLKNVFFTLPVYYTCISQS